MININLSLWNIQQRFFIHESISFVCILEICAVFELKRRLFIHIYFCFKFVTIELHHFNLKHHWGKDHGVESFCGEENTTKMEILWLQYFLKCLFIWRKDKKCLAFSYVVSRESLPDHWTGRAGHPSIYTRTWCWSQTSIIEET